MRQSSHYYYVRRISYITSKAISRISLPVLLIVLLSDLTLTFTYIFACIISIILMEVHLVSFRSFLGEVCRVISMTN